MCLQTNSAGENKNKFCIPHKVFVRWGAGVFDTAFGNHYNKRIENNLLNLTKIKRNKAF